MGLGITISVNGKNDTELAGAGQVEVYECIGETTFYTITYSEDVRDGDMNLLKDIRLDPGSLLSIAAEVEDKMVCLVKGPVVSQQIMLVHGGEGSYVQVRGGDSTITMDAEFKTKVWKDVTDGETATQIFGNYSLIPDVATTNARHLESKHSLVQNESDLRFVWRLARRNGCYFWITVDLPGEIERGHFQKPKLDASNAADLVINEKSNNISSLSIYWDTERPNSIIAKQIDLNTKEILEGDVSKTAQDILGSKSLQQVAKGTHSSRITTTVDDSGDLKGRGEAALTESDWFIRARCTTSLHQLKKLVRANTMVNVVGAGSRHSGKYLVYSVKHVIDPVNHAMEIELVRNGWNEEPGGATSLLPKF